MFPPRTSLPKWACSKFTFTFRFVTLFCSVLRELITGYTYHLELEYNAESN